MSTIDDRPSVAVRLFAAAGEEPSAMRMARIPGAGNVRVNSRHDRSDRGMCRIRPGSGASGCAGRG